VAVMVLALAGSVWVVRRIVRPIGRLSEAAAHIAEGNWEDDWAVPRSYAEIENLAKTFAGMQNAIHRRDRQLTDANEQLQDTNAQLAETNGNYMKMLGFVTHELKSPLAAMQMMIETVTSGLHGEVPEKLARPLTRIRRNCEELQDMVKNYLDLSRAERGELNADRRPIDVRAEILEPCAQQADSLVTSRNMKLEIESPETLAAEADAELLRIALSNYLSNAAKYGREGGVIRLTATSEGTDVHLSVWNEGEGFTEEDGKALFGKFARLRNANTRGKRGSGLGLFLCRQVAEQHGGRAWAESEPGHWARFNLSFPAKPAEPVDVTAQAEQHTPDRDRSAANR